MMGYFVLSLIYGIAVVGTVLALAYTNENQHPLDSHEFPDAENSGHGRPDRYRCDLPRRLDPSADGLASSHDLFSGRDALEALVGRHQSLVRIPSICYDDLGDFDEDERWEPFNKISKVLEDTYPTVHKYATVDVVNRFGLVYTVTGSDESLAPILLTAHQDVVPVEEETLDRWEYPPFDAVYDKAGGYLWGRGASDDKSRITALMSAMESLLSQEEYEPSRTVIFAFGFDEECSGPRGAGEIAKHLEKRYGEDGIAVILDEGGGGIQALGDTLYALPAGFEKGYLDVWFDIDVIGGHSSKPTPHTAIGIMSEIVVNLESNPFRAEIPRNGPVHQALVCLARYSPDAIPELTDYIYHDNLKGAARILTEASPDTQYFIQTSQAVTIISGGDKINSLPEFVTMGVNHRYAPQDSIGGIQYRIVDLVEPIVRKYDLRVKAFEDDEDYEEYHAARGISREEKARNLWEPIYNGSLKLEIRKKSYITPQTPTSGRIWDVSGGTVRHTYADKARHVVFAPGAMTGNTDTRHYLKLSKHIYRWSPGSLASFGNIHTVNERLLMSEHVDMVRFYYDFIRNFDQAEL